MLNLRLSNFISYAFSRKPGHAIGWSIRGNRELPKTQRRGGSVPSMLLNGDPPCKSSNPSLHGYGSSCRRSREMSRLDRSTLSGNN